MFRHRSVVLKWVGGVLVLGIAGWLLWQNQQADKTGWLFTQGTGLGVHQQDLGDGWGQRNSTGGRKLGATTQAGKSRSSTIPNEKDGGDTERGRDITNTGANQQGDSSEVGRIAIHAAGAVQKPGVYYLQDGARVVDVVKAAGGVAGNADLNAINLAGGVMDGEQVFIPYKDGSGSTGYVVRGGVTSSAAGSMTRSGSTSATRKASTSQGIEASYTSGSRSGGVKGKVNINTASVEELISLPGIGESKAEAIIRYREGRGTFQRPEDLMAVGGIGEKTYARLKDWITV